MIGTIFENRLDHRQRDHSLARMIYLRASENTLERILVDYFPTNCLPENLPAHLYSLRLRRNGKASYRLLSPSTKCHHVWLTQPSTPAVSSLRRDVDQSDCRPEVPEHGIDRLLVDQKCAGLADRLFQKSVTHASECARLCFLSRRHQSCF